jgi:hypothetical protein
MRTRPSRDAVAWSHKMFRHLLVVYSKSPREAYGASNAQWFEDVRSPEPVRRGSPCFDDNTRPAALSRANPAAQRLLRIRLRFNWHCFDQGLPVDW